MKVKDETREQFINELRLSRQRVTQLEALGTEPSGATTTTNARRNEQ